jgi:hypothetical protein
MPRNIGGDVMISVSPLITCSKEHVIVSPKNILLDYPMICHEQPYPVTEHTTGERMSVMQTARAALLPLPSSSFLITQLLERK